MQHTHTEHPQPSQTDHLDPHLQTPHIPSEIIPPKTELSLDKPPLSTDPPPYSDESSSSHLQYDDEHQTHLMIQAMWDRARVISTAESPQNKQMFHEWLRELCEQSSHTLTTLHQITHISENHLQALLWGEPENIPYESLMRGFTQSIATVLADNPEPIMLAYRSCYRRQFSEPVLKPSKSITGFSLHPLSKLNTLKQSLRLFIKTISQYLKGPQKIALITVIIISGLVLFSLLWPSQASSTPLSLHTLVIQRFAHSVDEFRSLILSVKHGHSWIVESV